MELIPNVIHLNDINKNGEYNDEIINYFKDFGMCLYNFLFEKKNASSKCNIF